MLQLPLGVKTGRASDYGESGGLDARWLQPGTLAQIPAPGRLWSTRTNRTVSGQVGLAEVSLECFISSSDEVF